MAAARTVSLALFACAACAVPAAHASTITFDRQSQRPGSDPQRRIWEIRPDGRGARRLATAPDSFNPDLSSDGRRLLWIDGPHNALRAGDKLGRNARVVLKRPVSGRFSYYLGNGRWSPNGKQIAFVEAAEMPEGTFAPRVRTGVLTLRTRKIKMFDGFELGGWSPDGRMLVGQHTDAPPPPPCSPVIGPCQPVKYTYRVQTLNVASGVVHDLATFEQGSAMAGTWAPKGNLIAFSRGEQEGIRAEQIWTVRPDGSGLHQIPSAPLGVWAPSFSPDGTQIAALAGGTKLNDHIVTLKSDGSGLRRITRDEYGPGAPDWAP